MGVGYKLDSHVFATGGRHRSLADALDTIALAGKELELRMNEILAKQGLDVNNEEG